MRTKNKVMKIWGEIEPEVQAVIAVIVKVSASVILLILVILVILLTRSFIDNNRYKPAGDLNGVPIILDGRTGETKTIKI